MTTSRTLLLLAAFTLLLAPPVAAAATPEAEANDCDGQLDTNCWGPRGICHVWIGATKTCLVFT